MTLKESQEGSWTDLSQLKKGDVVKGKVKRLEAFGAFVELHNSALTGLAHISEVSDDYVKNLQDALHVGQGGKASFIFFIFFICGPTSAVYQVSFIHVLVCLLVCVPVVALHTLEGCCTELVC